MRITKNLKPNDNTRNKNSILLSYMYLDAPRTRSTRVSFDLVPSPPNSTDCVVMKKRPPKKKKKKLSILEKKKKKYRTNTASFAACGSP